MATTSTMGQPTRTANKVWWAIAIVAAILIVMALMGRRDAVAPTTGIQSTTQGTMDTRNTDTTGVPAGTNTNAVPVPTTTPTNTVPNQ